MTRQTYGYRAYGLTIRSDLPLAELDADPAENPDIRVQLRPVPRRDGVAGDGTHFEFGEDYQRLSWEPVGAFAIHGTHTVDIDPAPDAEEQLLHLPLLGPIMAIMLHMRGFLTLHASAIEIGGSSAIFVGDKGAGKSTTAAAFVRAGHRLLTDDVVALDFSDPKHPLIAPAFPQIKLNMDAAEAVIVQNTTVLPEPVPGFVKRLQKLDDPFSHALATPRRVYVLERGGEPSATPLPPHEALKALMRFSYMTRFTDRPWSRAEANAHMRQCAALATAAQVCRLTAPVGLDRLPDLIKFVEQDLAAAEGGR